MRKAVIITQAKPLCHSYNQQPDAQCSVYPLLNAQIVYVHFPKYHNQRLIKSVLTRETKDA